MSMGSTPQALLALPNILGLNFALRRSESRTLHLYPLGPCRSALSRLMCICGGTVYFTLSLLHRSPSPSSSHPVASNSNFFFFFFSSTSFLAPTNYKSAVQNTRTSPLFTSSYSIVSRHARASSNDSPSRPPMLPCYHERFSAGGEIIHGPRMPMIISSSFQATPVYPYDVPGLLRSRPQVAPVPLTPSNLTSEA